MSKLQPRRFNQAWALPPATREVRRVRGQFGSCLRGGAVPYFSDSFSNAGRAGGALTYAVGHLPATVTSVSLLAQIPLTALLAAFLLGETLSGSQVLGGALVLAGVGLANRRSHPAEEANATLCEAGEHE
jgi:EamA-like transporter family